MVIKPLDACMSDQERAATERGLIRSSMAQWRQERQERARNRLALKLAIKELDALWTAAVKEIAE